MVLQQGGVMLPELGPQREGIFSQLQFGPPLYRFFFNESVASENNFSAINEDKRTGTLGVGCKILVYASGFVFIALLWCFYLKPSA